MTRIAIKDDLTGYDTFDGFTPVELPYDVKTGEEAFLGIVNSKLLEQRQHAWDHEAKENRKNGELPGIMFYGAALVRTKDNRYYVAANTHLQNSPATRNCAEAMAITEAAQETKASKLEIEEVWFLGGLGHMAKNIMTLPDQLGRRNVPCGSCLDVIFNHRVNHGAHTKVHLLPLNDGNWRLEPDDGSDPSELRVNQVMTRTIEELFPHISMFLPDEDGSLKQAIRRGWEFIKDSATVHSVRNAAEAGRCIALEEEPQNEEGIKTRINAIMMETLHKEYHASNQHLNNASIAVIRREDGNYYVGTYFHDGRRASTPSAIYNAIQNETMRGVTDVYIMTVDCRHMPELLEKFEAHPKEPVEAEMPDGEARDRINKVTPRNSIRSAHFEKDVLPVTNGDVPRVHVFLPNNIQDFNPDQHVVTKTIGQLLPYAFIGAKDQIAQRQ